MIGQIAINIQDVQRAVRLYRGILGMEHLFEILDAIL